MKKTILILSIFILILITTLVKNSTKKIEDEIFLVKENIRLLKSELGDILLEYNYLSSPDKLIQYQSQYFENDLIQKDIIDIKQIKEVDDHLIITDLNKKLENNE